MDEVTTILVAGFVSELKLKLDRVYKLCSHPAESGNYHELILASVLSNFLTKRFSVKTGFIYPSKYSSHSDNHSGQIDIMIIDENVANAYIFKEGDFAIVRAEAVVVVIEVKTRNINGKNLKNALGKLNKVKTLNDITEIRSILFVYEDLCITKKSLNIYGNKDVFNQTAPDLLVNLDNPHCYIKHYGGQKIAYDVVELVDENYKETGQLAIMIELIMYYCSHNSYGEYLGTRNNERFKVIKTIEL